jgi:hypothetical protein
VNAKSARARRTKLSSVKSLEAKCDRELSRFVRMSAADEGGTVQCVTCGKLAHWQEVDCGHYIKRQHRSTRWDVRNVAPQCRRCNRFAGGVMDEFASYIIRAHGLPGLEELMMLKHATKKWTRAELYDMAEQFKSAAREQEARVSVCEQ